MLNIDNSQTDPYTSKRMASPLQLSIVNFQRNSYIIVEGKQNADCFYIIRSGKVRISKEVEVVEEEGGNILAPGRLLRRHLHHVLPQPHRDRPGPDRRLPDLRAPRPVRPAHRAQRPGGHEDHPELLAQDALPRRGAHPAHLQEHRRASDPSPPVQGGRVLRAAEPVQPGLLRLLPVPAVLPARTRTRTRPRSAWRRSTPTPRPCTWTRPARTSPAPTRRTR